MRKEVFISIVMPIYNEEGNIEELFNTLLQVLNKFGRTFEVIAVNDGSCDESLANLREIAKKNPTLKVIDLARNFGQTAALMAGFEHVSGSIIVTIDADLQNDPNDIPLLISKIEEGYDVVSGWRQNRKDFVIRRNAMSQIANKIISRVTNVHLHDYGCTLKAYRREFVENLRLYGEMHRFIPIFASWMGARIVEVPVNHFSRKSGDSKYGLDRIFKVILDLLVVKFMDRHFVKPIYVFGGFGLLSLFASFILGSWTLYLKIFKNTSFILTPLPLLTAMTFLIGFIAILMGILAEMLNRTYYESQRLPTYFIRALINF